MSTSTIAMTIGRALVGASIGNMGRGALQKPAGPVKLATPALTELRKVVPLPFGDETAVRVNAGVQVAAGAMLVLGAAPRLAAGAMLGTLIPVTLAGHAFWKHPAGSPERAGQAVQFQKNLAMMGALVFIAGERSSRSR